MIILAGLAHLVRDILAPAISVRILVQSNPSAARNGYMPDTRKGQQHHALSARVPLA